MRRAAVLGCFALKGNNGIQPQVLRGVSGGQEVYLHARWHFDSLGHLASHVGFSVAFTYPFTIARAHTYTRPTLTTPPESAELTIPPKSVMSPHKGEAKPNTMTLWTFCREPLAMSTKKTRRAHDLHHNTPLACSPCVMDLLQYKHGTL